jgi:hypothetical protein
VRRDRARSGASGDAFGATVRALRLDEDDLHAEPCVSRAEVVARLRRIAAEALIRQDEAAVLLAEIRARGRLAELAPRGGTVVTRFVLLSEALPNPTEQDLRGLAERLRCVLDHHAMLISSALDLLAVDGRSESIAEQLDRLDGLGAPAEWLEAVWAALEDLAAPL